ncbi:UPF0764 protein C16orf89 homolog isoform X3 [Heterocephalus glaber]|uniref:UPF0764 protein C16orf89 homolog isoform X3 n=1 Tax=Heterocephalus glaber TaxID=10181 RepID=A0AAX6RWA9_HETGA|nr:UPF0764 protein C16orf89 homolog isoform X3 [Heterocephalus glaber]XP_021100093.1 UPF0764 protein C16orf89 homolog isoform X3 [Heterocephalus glaber]
MMENLGPEGQPSSLSQLDNTEGKATLSGLILSALERATTFLEERLPEINLDGVVGFQVLEVQLRGAQEAWALDPLLQPLSLRAGHLADKVAPLLHSSIAYLNLSDPEYLRAAFPPARVPAQPAARVLEATPHLDADQRLPSLPLAQAAGLLLRGQQRLMPGAAVGNRPPRKNTYTWNLCRREGWITNWADRLGLEHHPQQPGMASPRNTSSQPCGLSDFCRTLMTKPGCSGYYLSHQLLFFLWARMKGCTKGLFSQSQHYISIFCANMMDLNQRAEAIRYAYPIQDLFMENIMFCGIGGFSDFYKRRWLEAILSWQKPQEGCFGVPAAGDEVRHADRLYQQHALRRVKRREKQFTDGCSSHSTATAVAALGGFLYILADQPLVHGERHPSTLSQGSMTAAPLDLLP